MLFRSFTTVASKVPIGDSVLIDVAGADYASLVKIGAAAYYLPDRTVRVYAGTLRLGTFPDQNVRPAPCLFDYVISPVTPADGFSVVYADEALNLKLYKRDGARCAAG